MGGEGSTPREPGPGMTYAQVAARTGLPVGGQAHPVEPGVTLGELGVEDLRRIRLRPGDRLAAIVPPGLSREQMKRIREGLTAVVPNVPILLYTSDLELVVLGPGEEPGPADGEDGMRLEVEDDLLRWLRALPGRVRARLEGS